MVWDVMRRPHRYRSPRVGTSMVPGAQQREQSTHTSEVPGTSHSHPLAVSDEPITLSIVVFPDPDFPSMTTNSPFLMVSVTPRNAGTPSAS